MTGLHQHGHAIEAAWPYGMPPWPAPRPLDALEATNGRPLPAWHQLASATVPGITAELELGNPVILTVLFVKSAWEQARSDGRVDSPPSHKTRGRHAILVVGVLTQDGAEGDLVIKNSWGPAWGDHGYGFVSAGYLNAYALGAYALVV